jgi:hypothetical protein
MCFSKGGLAHCTYDLQYNPSNNITNLVGNWLAWVVKNISTNLSWCECLTLGHMDIQNHYIFSNAKTIIDPPFG